MFPKMGKAKDKSKKLKAVVPLFSLCLKGGGQPDFAKQKTLSGSVGDRPNLESAMLNISLWKKKVDAMKLEADIRLPKLGKT